MMTKQILHTTHRVQGHAMTIASLLVVAGALTFSHGSFGYDAVPVFNGGNLSGTVRLTGPLPDPKRYNLVVSSDPYYCGRVSDGKGWRLSPTVHLRSNEGVPNVIVYLEGVESGKPLNTQTPTIRAKDCRFLPYVTPVNTNKTLTFENWDPVPHNIEIFQVTNRGGKLLATQDLYRNRGSRKSDFLVAGPEGTHRPGHPFSYTASEEGRMVFRCSYHEYMEAWSLVLNHPYYSITDRSGQYAITDIPAGTFRLVLWHPLGQVGKTVQIQTKTTHTMDVQLHLHAPRSYQEDEPKPNPFGIDLTGDRGIVPTVERQDWPPEGKD